MEYFRFTLFNSLTLLIMALTILTGVSRWTGGLKSNWPLVYYAMLLGYTIGFKYGLNPYWISAGTLTALLIRFSRWGLRTRWAEAVVFGYVLWRCVGLILLW